LKLGALIFGQREDLHVTTIADALRRRDMDVVVFDQYRDQAAIDYTRGANDGRWPFADWIATKDGVCAVLRVKSPQGVVRPEFQDLDAAATDPVGPYQTKEFFRAEWRIFTRSVARWLMAQPGVWLLNRGEVSQDSGLKPLQLQVATEVGFAIPQTIIGNHEATIDESFGDEVLFKPLSATRAGGRGVPPPAILPKAAVLAHGRASVCSSIFQARVTKSHELRVLVAGETIRCVEIDSQSRRPTQLDWRVGEHKAEIFRLGSLPEGLRAPILAFMRRFELDVGVFDFAVEPSGRVVFFECNSAGQFLLMDLFTGVSFANDFAAEVALRAQTAAIGRLAA
jgi:hypothetical protein